MFIPSRILVLLIPALVLGCATGPSGESYDSPVGKWTEQWENSSGQIKTARLEILDEARAQYTGSNDTQVEFYAIEDQFTWKGYWIGEGHTSCSEEKGGIDSWGEQTFHFNETYTRYKGTWDYCGQGRKYSMTGAR